MHVVLVASNDRSRGDKIVLDLSDFGLLGTRIGVSDLCSEFQPEWNPDLVLLDAVGALDEEIKQVVLTCREKHLPVLALVAAPDSIANNGSINPDDFILEPLNCRELLARIRQIVARRPNRDETSMIRIGNLVIDETKYDVQIDGYRINLTFKEYQLLRLLAANPGKVFSRDELLSRIWGYEYFGGTRTVDVHIRRLRSKVDGTHGELIETVRNVGYRFRIFNPVR